MNFEHIPFAHHQYGFEIAVAVQVALSLVLLLILRRRGML
jgi:Mg2+ and Co2+ transporter CorA